MTGTIPPIDAMGTHHAPFQGAPRIVSLVPSLTELLVDLGLGGCVVGRTKWCVHPAEAVRTIPTVGGTKKANLKRIRTLEPTHVVLNIDENPKAMAEALAEFVPNVIVTHPLAPEDNPGLYRLLGGIFRREEEAERLCASFDAEWNALTALRSTLPERTVLYLIWKDPWMTITRDTYIARTLEAIGWRHAVSNPTVRYPQITESEMTGLVRNVDFLLFSSEPYAFTEEHLDAFAAKYDIARDRLLVIDGEMTSWYGSRAIAGLRYLRAMAESMAVNPSA